MSFRNHHQYTGLGRPSQNNTHRTEQTYQFHTYTGPPQGGSTASSSALSTRGFDNSSHRNGHASSNNNSGKSNFGGNKKRKADQTQTKNWVELCHKLLKDMMELDVAKPFMYSSATTAKRYSDYITKVRNHMDLNIVRVKLSQRQYTWHTGFAADVRLIFSNWMGFINDKASTVYAQIVGLKMFFDVEYKKIQEQLEANKSNKRLRMVPSVSSASFTQTTTSPARNPSGGQSPAAAGSTGASSSPSLSSSLMSQLNGVLPQEQVKRVAEYMKQKGLPQSMTTEVLKRIREKAEKTKKAKASSAGGSSSLNNTRTGQSATPPSSQSRPSPGLAPSLTTPSSQNRSSSSGVGPSLATPSLTTQSLATPSSTQASRRVVAPGSTSATIHSTDRSASSFNSLQSTPQCSVPSGGPTQTSPSSPSAVETEPGSGQLVLQLDTSNVWFGPCRTRENKVTISENGIKVMVEQGNTEVPFYIKSDEVVRVAAHFTKNKKQTVFIFTTPSCEKRMKDEAEKNGLFNNHLKSTDCTTLIAIFANISQQVDKSILIHIFHEMEKGSIFKPLFCEVDQQGALEILSNIKPQVKTKYARKVRIRSGGLDSSEGDHTQRGTNSDCGEQLTPNKTPDNQTSNTFQFTASGERRSGSNQSLESGNDNHVVPTAHSISRESGATSTTPYSTVDSSSLLGSFQDPHVSPHTAAAAATAAQRDTARMPETDNRRVPPITISLSNIPSYRDNISPPAILSSPLNNEPPYSLGFSPVYDATSPTVSSVSPVYSSGVFEPLPPSDNRTNSGSLRPQVGVTSLASPLPDNLFDPPFRVGPEMSPDLGNMPPVLDQSQKSPRPGQSADSPATDGEARSNTPMAEEDFSNNDLDLEIIIPSDSDDELTYMDSATQEGDDLMMVRTSISTKCPITQTTMSNPVKNNHCGHRYDREGVQQLITNRGAKAKCPVPGCSNQTKLMMQDMIYDEEVAKIIGTKVK